MDATTQLAHQSDGGATRSGYPAGSLVMRRSFYCNDVGAGSIQALRHIIQQGLNHGRPKNLAHCISEIEPGSDSQSDKVFVEMLGRHVFY
jgi:hypothetical protein